DLFLTTWHERLGGAHPKQEAVLRALSCGPVGIGDAPGATDAGLVRSMLSSDGRLLQPDRPPFPIVEKLGAPIEVYRTHRRAGGLTWTYLVILNTTDQSQAYDVVNDLRNTDVLIWDGLAGRIADSISGTLPSGCLAYYVLVPYVAGIAPLGLRDKLVPAPVSAVQDVRSSGVLEIDVNAPGEAFAFATKGSMAVADQHGTPLPIEHDGSLWICVIPEGATSLHVRGGDLP
ncbi:hypothetical protein KJ567_02665, partial [Candidatus Bipolaricaulota bacterium]|nr:hypothetical protein [Candidatus Bipolaricaulota bacterium]